MKFCTNCGARLGEGDLFCRNCGTRLGASGSGNPYQGGTPDPYGDASGSPYGQSGYYGNTSDTSDFGGQSDPYGYASEPTDFGGQDGYSDDWTGGGAAGGRGVGSGRGNGSKGKAGIIILAAVIAALALGAVSVFALPGPKNLFKRMFSSPEKYYQYVEEQTIDELSSQAASAYDNLIRSNLNVDNRGVDYSIRFAVSDDAKNLIQKAASSFGIGVSSDWLGSVSLDGKIDTKNGKSLVTANASLNETQIFSANIIADLAKNMVYGQIPEISPDYIAGDLSALEEQTGYLPESALGILRDVYKACPDEKTFEKLVTKYMKAVIESVETVDKESASLTAGRISADYTALHVTIDARTISKALGAVADLMEDDKELRSIVDNLLVIAGESVTASYYDSAVSEIRSYAEQTASYTGTESVMMTVYVDRRGEIVGRTISTGEGEILRYAAPKDGSDIGFLLQAAVDGESFAISGDGTLSRGRLSGDYRISVTLDGNSQEVLRVSAKDFDTDDFKEGYVNGTFSVSPGLDLLKMLNQYDIDRTYQMLLAGVAVDIDMRNSKNNYSTTLGLSFNGASLGSVSIGSSTRNANDFSMIKTAKTPELYMKDLDSSGISKIIRSLENAGVPSSLTMYLEQYAQDLTNK